MLQAMGPADAVQAALLNLPDVTDALVVQNDTGAEADGVAANSIWAIVENGTPADIADVIYKKKSMGCGLQGGQTVTINRSNGIPVTVKYDRPDYTPLHITVKLVARVYGTIFDTANDEALLAAALSYRLNQTATIGDIVIAMAAIEPTAICTAIGVSASAGSYTDTLKPSDYQHKFSVDAANITITQDEPA